MKNSYYLFLLSLIVLFASCDDDDGLIFQEIEPTCYDPAVFGTPNPAEFNGVPENCQTNSVSEDFSDNRFGWFTVIDNNLNVFFEIVNGSFRLSTNEVNYHIWAPDFGELGRNFELEADFKFVSDNDANNYVGLSFGLIQGSPFLGSYFFLIRADQQFSIGKVENYNEANDPNFETFPAILDEQNRLTVRLWEGILYFFINSELAATIQDVELAGTRSGIRLTGSTNVEVDNYRATRYDGL